MGDWLPDANACENHYTICFEKILYLCVEKTYVVRMVTLLEDGPSLEAYMVSKATWMRNGSGYFH